MEKTKEEKSYIKKQLLGRGGFGDVFRVQRNSDKEEYAMKTVMIDGGDEATAMKETDLLKTLCHPNIIRYVDEFVSDDKQYFCIIMELATGGTLKDQVKKGGVPVMQAVHWFTQVCLALQYMHSRRCIHRDLKPENAFLEGLTVKLGDFGLSKALTSLQSRAGTKAGTYSYMAPEMIEGLEYTEKVDIWSAGVMLFELICGYRPFKGDSEYILFKAIRKQPPELFLAGVRLDIQQLVHSMLSKDPSQRPSITEVLDHPLIAMQVKWIVSYGREIDMQLSQSTRELYGACYFDGLDLTMTMRQIKSRPVKLQFRVGLNSGIIDGIQTGEYSMEIDSKSIKINVEVASMSDEWIIFEMETDELTLFGDEGSAYGRILDILEVSSGMLVGSAPILRTQNDKPRTPIRREQSLMHVSPLTDPSPKKNISTSRSQSYSDSSNTKPEEEEEKTSVQEVKRIPVKDGGSGLRFIVTYKNVIYAGDYDLKELIIISDDVI